eukprot:CAMPEP_0114553058 /NCGR_PEP_ID=MMETSP0114-20121206/7453_1 /TAXON_ID=31324 /ORGANISM="Goniomonas sp, Strain m" /LENGTH=272 /DNA_ID=CAMNT_0001737971 /DNA_START=65 /DNA_END=883 /DNA_ORIENTATION=+
MSSCATADRIGSYIAGMIENNEHRIMLGDEEDTLVTVFHSEVLPLISFDQYYKHLRCFRGISPSCYVAAAVYLERVLSRSAGMLLTSFNAHRLYLTCLVLATKFVEDLSYRNSAWAALGGVALSELNLLERELLAILSFELHITCAQYQSIKACLWDSCVIPESMVPSIDYYQLTLPTELSPQKKRYTPEIDFVPTDMVVPDSYPYGYERSQKRRFVQPAVGHEDISDMSRAATPDLHQREFKPLSWSLKYSPHFSTDMEFLMAHRLVPHDL